MQPKEISTARASGSNNWMLTSLALCVLLPALGTSIANVALPNLASAFNASFQQVQWIVLAYLLAMTSLMVTLGRLGDLIGRRRLLLVGIGLYTLASACCAITSSLGLLITARAVQGLGAAAMMVLAMAMVAGSVPKAKSGNAMGLLASMSAIGTALGPALGGLLLAGPGWRAIFLIMLPIGLLTLWLAVCHLPGESAELRPARPRLDLVGTLVLILALASYALALTLGRGSFGLLNLTLMLLAVGGLGLFVLVERQAPWPLIEMQTFRAAGLRSSLAMNLLVATVMMATLVIGPFHLAVALALDPLLAGLVLTAGPLVAAMSGAPAGRIVDRFGAPCGSLSGLVAIGIGCAALTLIPTNWGIVGYLVPMIIITAGYALFQTANNTAVLGAARADQRGLVSGLLNLSRNLGLITGAAAMGAVFAAVVVTEIDVATPAAVAAGTRITFLVATVLITIAAIVARANASKSSAHTGIDPV